MRSLRHARVALLVAVISVAAASTSGGSRARERANAPSGCPPTRIKTATPAEVSRALRARRDRWGERLLAAPGGPTYGRARRHLAPILLARARGGAPLTVSGFHYVPFGVPRGDAGTSTIALHVADGGQVLSRHVGGPALTVLVGEGSRERYGSCRSRLGAPKLVEGWLPILATSYTDAAGARYGQESFAARERASGTLVSFVRLTVDAGAANSAVRARFAPTVRSVDVAAGARRTVYVAWAHAPKAVPRFTDRATYSAARRSVARFWRNRLASGAAITVPERRVQDAVRALLVQNLVLTWRYSAGNPYQQFSFPEGIDVAQVMGELGFAGVDRAIVRTSLTRSPTPYPNWKRGEKLLGTAAYYRLFRDRAFVSEVTPVLRRYVTDLGRQLDASPLRLLARDRYSSDIPDPVYGLHAQAVVWQGLRAMSLVWTETGQIALARRSAMLAARLETGLRRAVRVSQRRLPDGSLFLPVRLLDPEKPYGSVTESRSGSYWNLVVPYALASGLFRPGGEVANGAWAYMQRHGSRLLGLVRAGAYALYGRAADGKSGTDQVYGNNVSRFLADNDRADQLVLTLYGALAAAMAPGTFVAGEAASVAALDHSRLRSTYLPPNGASNATFLETVRLMLVHETTRAGGAPDGLELAYATPRAWLRPGRRIIVRSLPTAFGPLSFSLHADTQTVQASVDVPARATPRTLRLRLRLPDGRRIAGVRLDGRDHRRFDARTAVIDLSGQTGRIELVISLGAGRG